MSGLSRLLPRMALLQALEITGVVTFFLFVPVLTHGFGAEAVGVYAVIRRAMGFGIPLATLGLNESLPYSVAVSRDAPGLGGAVVGCLFATLGVGAAILCASLLLDGITSRLLFGSGELRTYVIPAALLLVTTAVASIFGSVARGLDDFGTFAWIVLAIAASPFIALLLSGGSLRDTLIAMAGIAAILSAGGMARLFPQIRRIRIRGAFADAREFLRISVARLPGVLLMGTLPFVIVLLVKETVGLARTGQFAVVLSIMVAVGGVATAFGIAALPGLAASWRAGRRAETREAVIDALSATASIMLLGAGILYAAASRVGGYLFGPAQDANHLIQTAVLLVPVLGINAILRYVVDAVSDRAINTRIYAIATGITLPLCLAGMHFAPAFMTESAYILAYLGCHGLVLLLSILFARDAGLDVFPGAVEVSKNAVAGALVALAVIFAARWTASLATFIGLAILSGVLLVALLLLLRAHWLQRLLGGMRTLRG